MSSLLPFEQRKASAINLTRDHNVSRAESSPSKQSGQVAASSGKVSLETANADVAAHANQTTSSVGLAHAGPALNSLAAAQTHPVAAGVRPNWETQTPSAVQNMSMNTTNRMEDNLNLNDDEDQDDEDEEPQTVKTIDYCCNRRFLKHNEFISKSKYRTIHRGYDNESGCEIAWTTYPLHNYKKERLLKTLDQVREIRHKNILRVIYYEVRVIERAQVLPPKAH